MEREGGREKRHGIERVVDGEKEGGKGKESREKRLERGRQMEEGGVEEGARWRREG